MLLVAKLPVSIKSFKNSREGKEARSIRWLNSEDQSKGAGQLSCCGIVVVAETGSWFWFGQAQSFQVPRQDGILESTLRSSNGGYEGANQVHFGTLHFFSSAIHHLLSSSSCSLYFQFFSSSLYSMHQIQKAFWHW